MSSMYLWDPDPQPWSHHDIPAVALPSIVGSHSHQRGDNVLGQNPQHSMPTQVDSMPPGPKSPCIYADTNDPSHTAQLIVLAVTFMSLHMWSWNPAPQTWSLGVACAQGAFMKWTVMWVVFCPPNALFLCSWEQAAALVASYLSPQCHLPSK